MEAKIYIIVLNYNNWQDTIECCTSILQNNYKNYTLIVVDNASPDNSIKHITRWSKSHKNVVVIASQQNNGYSAGNNLGIDYVKTKGDFDYIWLLNNDTVIQKDTITNMIQYARQHRLNLIGSSLLFYDDPTKIQAFGATFNPLIAIQKHLLVHRIYKTELVRKFNQKKIDYIIGASMMLDKKAIKTINRMPEEYFIYFEEIDIATKCKRAGLRYGISPDAIVYHKESASINKEDQKRSHFSDFFAIRNRIIFTKKYYPYFLPTVYIGLIFSLLLRLKRKDSGGTQNIIRVLQTPLKDIETLRFN